jgi:hypothetical protein
MSQSLITQPAPATRRARAARSCDGRRLPAVYFVGPSVHGAGSADRDSSTRALIATSHALIRRGEIAPFVAIVLPSEPGRIIDRLESVDPIYRSRARREDRILVSLPGRAGEALATALGAGCPFGTVGIWPGGTLDERMRASLAELPRRPITSDPTRVFISVDGSSGSLGARDAYAIVDDLARHGVPYHLWRGGSQSTLDDRLGATLRFALLPSQEVA